MLTVKKFILCLCDYTKKMVTGDIEVQIVLSSLLSVYVVDIVFNDKNNIGIVAVAVVISLFRLLRG